MYIIWFTANIHGVLDHFSLDFKTLFLGLEVAMRFKALYNENNICCVVKITSDYHWEEIYLLVWLCLRNLPITTKQNLAHTQIIEKMGLKFRSLIFQEENITFVWQKWLGLCRKRSIVKNLNKLKIHKIFSKTQDIW